MKKLLICLTICITGLGCATHYDITDSRGNIVRSTIKPQLDAQGRDYVYKTANGEVHTINKMRVRKIEAVSPGDRPSTGFNTP